jgi:transcriptional regulator of acetoin/glycerol metabolism
MTRTARKRYRGVGEMKARKTPAVSKPKPGNAGPRSGGRLQQAIDRTVKREIGRALTEAAGNVSEAARALGISRPSLWARMRALKIAAPR